MKVEALFRFNDEGLLTSVETGDRYYSNGKGAHKKVRFSAVIESDKTQRAILIPEKMKAVLHLPEGDYE